MLIGRDGALARVAGLLEDARTSEGASLVLTGDPGIGKTAVLEACTGLADGFVVLRAHGVESEADLPFAALSDLLRPVERHFSKIPAPQERMLRAALALGEPMNGDRLAVGVATLGVLTSAARRRPVLVVVDDLHWIDSASVLTLAFVARRLAATKIALVAAARPQVSGELPSELPLFTLEPLASAEAEQLVRATAAPSIPVTLVRRVVDLAAGNPLALVELPSLISSDHQTGGTPFDPDVSHSVALERAFGAQVGALPGTARRALLFASASAGAAATIRKALESGGLPVDALDPAERAGLVTVEGTRLRFRHPLVASVVYQRASAPERRSIHRTLAQVETDDDRRAWHLAAAATPPDEEAASALEAAGMRALRRGAAAESARALDRAAELSADAPERGRRLALAARAAHRAGDLRLTSRLTAAARELVDDRSTRADLLILESDIRMRGGDWEGAHAALAAEAEELARHDPRRTATMLLLAAKLHVYRFEAAAALGGVERALELYPEGRREALHLTALAMTRAMVGHVDALDAARAAAAAALDSPNGHVHTLGIAWPLVWLEEYQAARDLTGRSIVVQREEGVLAYLPQALLALSELDFRTGRWTQAEASALEALELFHETEQPTEAAVAAGTLARLEAARGDEDACRAHADAAIVSDGASGLRAATAFALAALGHLALASGRAEPAIKSLRGAHAILVTGGVGHPWLLPVHADLAEAYVHEGAVGPAADMADALETLAVASGSWSAQAAAARCRGLLAGRDDFEASFERALELHAGQPTPFERARTELCYGERLRRARRRREARVHLKPALDVFEGLRAARWAERARTELQASGERRQPDAALRRALTAHELKVARLVVDGASNREAASALYVSPKTIEFHLGNVYRKLGVRSRTQLARALADGER